MELHEQQRFLAQRELAVRVHHAHGVGVDEFHARDRHAKLNGLDHGAHGGFDAGERADGRAHRFRQRIQAHRDFGEDAQRALAAHQQAREIVARRALLGARAGADRLALSGDHFQRQHVLTHGAVAHGVGAAGACRCHAADAGIRARIDGEEQARVLDGFVELLARDAGLHGDGEVVRVDGQDLVHAAYVDADAALDGQQMAFERRARAVGNHRHLILRGQLHRVLHILRAFGKHHGRRRGRLQRTLVAPVLLAHGQRAGILRTEARGQRIQERLRHGAQLHGGQQVIGVGGGVHGVLLGGGWRW
ncbi:hypothetical protein SDC9_101366 [bioreactor metagenome]|uniref:Uncharacterized protein n=1 Tax=bioreactor metagenome TaxID=1076179 RepID=A0A645AP97_9ZZZZ